MDPEGYCEVPLDLSFASGTLDDYRTPLNRAPLELVAPRTPRVAA
jgi:hypothetical protein